MVSCTGFQFSRRKKKDLENKVFYEGEGRVNPTNLPTMVRVKISQTFDFFSEILFKFHECFPKEKKK